MIYDAHAWLRRSKQEPTKTAMHTNCCPEHIYGVAWCDAGMNVTSRLDELLRVHGLRNVVRDMAWPTASIDQVYAQDVPS